VMVISVDQKSQRISLSIKALAESQESQNDDAAATEPGSGEKASSTSSKRKKPETPLHGGLGKSTGSGFGLKW
ncbi:MAG: hypothetical protein ACWGMZ_12410, partial [Thermoguttaceae bacterium]